MIEKSEDGDQEDPVLLCGVIISMYSNTYVLIFWIFMKNLLKEAANKRYKLGNKAFGF